MSSPIKTLKVWNDTGKGRDTHIEIDGEDVSGACHDMTIHASATGSVTVELDTGVYEVTRANGMRLVFTGGARDLLIKYGWIPPYDGGA